MSFYPKKINSRFQNPRNSGNTSEENAVGTNAAISCGAFLRIGLKIDPETKEICDAAFTTNGCGYLMAAADLLTETLAGLKLTGLEGFGSLQEIIIADLGPFPESRHHCLELALDALKDAFADFRARQVEEFIGEKALICTCFGVSEETLEEIIDTKHPETVDEVGELARAGTGCGSCQQLIREILDNRKGR